jgi:hypothetical protein
MRGSGWRPMRISITDASAEKAATTEGE